MPPASSESGAKYHIDEVRRCVGRYSIHVRTNLGEAPQKTGAKIVLKVAKATNLKGSQGIWSIKSITIRMYTVYKHIGINCTSI